MAERAHHKKGQRALHHPHHHANQQHDHGHGHGHAAQTYQPKHAGAAAATTSPKAKASAAANAIAAHSSVANVAKVAAVGSLTLTAPTAVLSSVQFNAAAKEFVPGASFQSQTQPVPTPIADAVRPNAGTMHHITDLVSLYLAATHTSSWSALASLAPPAHDTLILCLTQLAADVNDSEPRYFDQHHLKLLHLLQSWMWIALQPTSASLQSLTDSWLSQPQSLSVSLSLLSLSTHPYDEIRLTVARLIRAYARCVNLAQSLSSPSSLLSLTDTDSVAVMPSHWQAALTLFGRVALERITDDCEEVCQVYRDVLGWCGILTSSHPAHTAVKRKTNEKVSVAVKRALTVNSVKQHLNGNDRDHDSDNENDSVDDGHKPDDDSSSDSEGEHGHLSNDDSDVARLSDEDRTSPRPTMLFKRAIKSKKPPVTNDSNDSDNDMDSVGYRRTSTSRNAAIVPITTTATTARLDPPAPLSEYSTPLAVFHAILTAPHSRLIKSYEFQRVTSSVLAAVSPIIINRASSRVSDVRWVQSLVHSHHSLLSSSLSQSLSLIGNNHRYYYYYLLVSVCKFLIHSQLKSPYGREIATLTHFDRVLSGVLKSRMASVSECVSGNNSNDSDHENDSAAPIDAFPVSAIPFDLIGNIHSLHSLQSFFFLFAKYVNLAIQPVCSDSEDVYQVDRQSSLFYQQNRQSCDLFFQRLQPKLLSLAVASEDHCAVLFIGNQLRLTYADSLTDSGGDSDNGAATVKELIKCVSAVCYSAMKLGDAHSLRDVYEWAQQSTVAVSKNFLTQSTNDCNHSDNESVETVVLLRLFPWLPGLLLQCEQRYELATIAYLTILAPTFPLPQHLASSATIVTMIVPKVTYVLTSHSRRVLHRLAKESLMAVADYATLTAYHRHENAAVTDAELPSIIAAQLLSDVLLRGVKGKDVSGIQSLIKLSVNRTLRLVQSAHDEMTGTATVTDAGTDTGPLILDVDDYHSLSADYFSYGVLDLCAGGTLLTQPSSARDSVTKLKSLSVWDIGNAPHIEALSVSDSNDSDNDSPIVSSALIALSCTAALTQRSMAPLQSLFASLSDPLTFDRLTTSDMLRVLTVIETLLRIDGLSKTLTPCDGHMARSYLFAALSHAVNHSNHSLAGRLAKTHALLFPSSSLSLLHKNELCWYRCISLCANDRYDEAFTVMWQQHERLSAMHKDSLTLINLSSLIPSLTIDMGGHAHSDTAALHQSHACHLLRLNRVVATVQSHSDSDPVIERAVAAITKARSDSILPSAPLTTSGRRSGGIPSQSQPHSQPVTNQSSVLAGMRLYALTRACQLASTEQSWLAYSRWCESVLTQQLSTDTDRVALARLVQGFESFSSAADSAIEHLHSAIVTSVANIVNSTDSVSDDGIRHRLRGEIETAIAKLFSDDDSSDSNDSLSLPSSFVTAILAIAESRLLRTFATLRTNLAARLTATKLTRTVGRFQHSIDSATKLVDAAYHSAPLYADIIVRALTSVPVTAWSFVAVQVYASLQSLMANNLTHSLAYRSLSLLLTIIGEAQPQCVVFELTAKLNESPSPERREWERLRALIDGRAGSTFVAGLGSLGAVQPTRLPTDTELAALTFHPITSATTTVSQFVALQSSVSSLCDELHRVGYLLEDSLLHSCRLIQSDLPSRLKLLMDELDEEKIESVTSTAVLWDVDSKREARYRLIFAPLIAQCNEMKAICASENSHSAQGKPGKRKWSKLIAKLIESLMTPTVSDFADPLAFGQRLAISLNELKRGLSKSSVIELADIAPMLTASSYSQSSIALPGLSGDAAVHSFANTVSIIRTKTRPKRLTVLATDGQCIPFLLKGREDLHMDARIMQAITAANLALTEQRARCASHGHGCDAIVNEVTQRHECVTGDLTAQTYPVIPLSSSLGLLRWIERATPIFDLYKQRRESAKLRRKPASASTSVSDNNDSDFATSGGGNDKDSKSLPVDRDVKMNQFYLERIMAALHDAGLSTRTPRRDWPLSVMRRVYEEMRLDCLDDLIPCHWNVRAPTIAAYLASQRAFIASLASMSIIGYWLGIGDRHLGNMLLTSDGSVLHIDFNVSLERGLRLPVPEIVPFRLTPALRLACRDDTITATATATVPRMTAFRSQATAVLACLRSHASPMMALLQCFVRDPITEWKSATDSKSSLTDALRVDDSVMSMTLLAQRLRRRDALIETVYRELHRSLPVLDQCVARLVAAASNNSVELQSLLALEMESLGHSLSALQLQQRRSFLAADTSNLAIEIDSLSQRYQLVANLQQRLQSSTIIQSIDDENDSGNDSDSDREMIARYQRYQLDTMHQSLLALAPILDSHAALVRSLRLLLTIVAKSLSPHRDHIGAVRANIEKLHNCLVALMQCHDSASVIAKYEAAFLATGGAGVSVSALHSLKSLSGWLHRALSSAPAMLELEVKTLRDCNGLPPASSKNTGTGSSNSIVAIIDRLDVRLRGVERRGAASAPLSAAAEVVQLLGEAVCVDRLCRMYEGWASWI